MALFYFLFAVGFLCSQKVVDAAITWSAATATGSIKECDPTGTAIPYTGAVSGHSGTPTFSITSQTPDSTPNLFEVESDANVLKSMTSTSSMADYETTQSYDVVITATDTNGDTATIIITVSVTDCNDVTPILLHQTIVAMGGETAGTELTTFKARDEDGSSPNNQVSTYTFASGNGGGYIAISNAGVITVASGMTLVTTSGTIYTYVITAADSGTDPSALTGTGTLSICIGSCSGSAGLQLSITLLASCLAGLLQAFV